MSDGVTGPREVLALATDLLDNGFPNAAGVWPRATALLARQALEAALDVLWQSWAPGLEDVSARCQLICLKGLMTDHDLATDTDHAWWALSRACHYQPYDLVPTVDELRRWTDTVGRIVTRAEAVAESPS